MDLKNDIIKSNNNYINNLLIIDLEDLDKIFDEEDCIEEKTKKVFIIDDIKKSNEESGFSSYIGTDEKILSDKEIKLGKKIILFLLKKRILYNVTIILIARKYIKLNFYPLYLYMGFESDNKILFHNYNKFGFDSRLGFDLFKTVNLELVKGKFLSNKINYFNRK